MWRPQNSNLVKAVSFWPFSIRLSNTVSTIVGLGCLMLCLSGCGPAQRASNGQTGGEVTGASSSGSSARASASVITPGTRPGTAAASGTSELVTGSTAAKQEKRPVFDADAAFTILKKQCEYGPRPLGTEAHEKAKDYLLSEMKKYADETVTQTFRYHNLPVTNVLGIFYPAGSTMPAKNPVLLLTHWDSRPIADGPFSSTIKKGVNYRYGPRGWNQTNPIMAANDGASGPAIMLELAKMFKERKPPVGVVMLLDDGEDYGDFRANNNAGDGVELGSRYFAEHYREDKRFGFPDYGILLDMVGGKDLVLPIEQISLRNAPGTVTKVYRAGENLGYRSVFRSDLEFQVEDDHIALIKAGMKVIDLIPYFGDSAPVGVAGYTYWHTLEDTVDKCSPNALKVVGETVADVIYNETPAP